MADVRCGECGAPMELRNGFFGQFYSCTRFPVCRGVHGAHPDGSPLGIPADQATRKARVAAHEAFDRLWTSGWMSRKEAYRWMQTTLGLTKAEAHIGSFTSEQCATLIDAVASAEAVK